MSSSATGLDDRLADSVRLLNQNSEQQSSVEQPRGQHPAARPKGQHLVRDLFQMHKYRSLDASPSSTRNPFELGGNTNQEQQPVLMLPEIHSRNDLQYSPQKQEMSDYDHGNHGNPFFRPSHGRSRQANNTYQTIQASADMPLAVLDVLPDRQRALMVESHNHFADALSSIKLTNGPLRRRGQRQTPQKLLYQTYKKQAIPLGEHNIKKTVNQIVTKALQCGERRVNPNNTAHATTVNKFA